jgi:hypothetical protein
MLEEYLKIKIWAWELLIGRTYIPGVKNFKFTLDILDLNSV